MLRGPFESGGIYHIYNRGVDKRITFTDEDDFRYFTHFLYTLNNSTDAPANSRRDFLLREKSKNRFQTQSQTLHNEGGSTSLIVKKKEKRDKLVEILAFVLMPNHYHLLLKQNTDNGIAKFMQKVGTGYTMMFNEKYKRSGSLFQGRYKSVHISSDEQLLYIPHYIHLNPLSNKKVTSTIEGLEFLKQYKWSSFQDYAGIKNFPSVTSRELILSLFGSSKKYVSNLLSVLEGKVLISSFDNKDLIDFNE